MISPENNSSLVSIDYDNLELTKIKKIVKKINGFLEKHSLLECDKNCHNKEREIVKRQTIILLPLIIGTLAIGWGSIFLILDKVASAMIPWSYAILSWLSFLYIIKTKNFKLFEISQLVMVLILPFVLMWSLGGFAQGSFFMIWSLFSPIAALAYSSEKNKFNWFYGFILLTIISIMIDPLLIKIVKPLPVIITELFFGLNIIAGFAGIMILVNSFIDSKKQLADEKIRIINTELLLKKNELEIMNKNLHKLAHHDDLTGLSNRKQLKMFLQHEIELADLHNHKMGVMFIDLDRFKEINDSLGHCIGDEVLKHISRILENNIRSDDIVSRLGGDEFVIVVNNLREMENLPILAEKLIKKIQEPIIIDSNKLIVTCSVGISLYPDDATSADDLLRNADTAMYKAKEEGKNNYQFYNKELTTK
jgi:diguanylate cyclase (GGDEF)-like protein